VVGGDKKALRDFKTTRKSRTLRTTSVGASKWVFVKHFDTVKECIEHLRKNLYTIAVTSSHDKGKNVDLYEEEFTQKRLAVWFGNEARGVSGEAIDAADICIRIPMGGIVESLNLGTSTGIVLSFISYQRLKFVFTYKKARIKSRGLGKLITRSWKDFINPHR